MKPALAWMVLVGCGPTVEPLQGDTTAAMSGSSSTTIASGSTSAPESTGPTTGSTAEDTGGSPFLVVPDGGSASTQCSLFGHACPPGEKCMPWADDGGNAWNATRCSPLDDDPRRVGEPCTAVGSGVSGIDDCEIGSMCWDVDPETLMGRCVGFCQGDQSQPICPDPCERCQISDGSVLVLCLPPCDPLAQDCPDGRACYAIQETFLCYPHGSPDQGAAGDPCDHFAACDPGNVCAPADAVPGCAGATGCCAPYCDASAPDVCDGFLPGTSCVPWFEPGHGLGGCLGGGIVGACLSPV